MAKNVTKTQTYNMLLHRSVKSDENLTYFDITNMILVDREKFKKLTGIKNRSRLEKERGSRISNLVSSVSKGFDIDLESAYNYSSSRSLPFIIISRYQEERLLECLKKDKNVKDYKADKSYFRYNGAINEVYNFWNIYNMTFVKEVKRGKQKGNFKIVIRSKNGDHVIENSSCVTQDMRDIGVAFKNNYKGYLKYRQDFARLLKNTDIDVKHISVIKTTEEVVASINKEKIVVYKEEKDNIDMPIVKEESTIERKDTDSIKVTPKDHMKRKPYSLLERNVECVDEEKGTEDKFLNIENSTEEIVEEGLKEDLNNDETSKKGLNKVTNWICNSLKVNANFNSLDLANILGDMITMGDYDSKYDNMPDVDNSKALRPILDRVSYMLLSINDGYIEIMNLATAMQSFGLPFNLTMLYSKVLSFC